MFKKNQANFNAAIILIITTVFFVPFFTTWNFHLYLQLKSYKYNAPHILLKDIKCKKTLHLVPVLLVATQTDLREMGAHRGSCITAAEGRQVAHEIHAKGYLECSSLNNRGVQQVFEYAVRMAVNQAKKQARRRMFSINQCKVFWPLTLTWWAPEPSWEDFFSRTHYLSVLFKLREGRGIRTQSRVSLTQSSLSLMVSSPPMTLRNSNLIWN